MLLNPNCHALSKGSITVGLEFDTSAIPPNNRLLMNYLLRLVEQNNKDEDIEVFGEYIYIYIYNVFFILVFLLIYSLS